MKMLLLGFGLAIAVSALLNGCSALQPADKYRPHENFGDFGATRCGTFNTPKQWLKPCR